MILKNTASAGLTDIQLYFAQIIFSRERSRRVEMGKVVVAVNPSAQLVGNRTGSVVAKLQLTCCPVWDRGKTRESV